MGGGEGGVEEGLCVQLEVAFNEKLVLSFALSCHVSAGLLCYMSFVIPPTLSDYLL